MNITVFAPQDGGAGILHATLWPENCCLLTGPRGILIRSKTRAVNVYEIGILPRRAWSACATFTPPSRLLTAAAFSWSDNIIWRQFCTVSVAVACSVEFLPSNLVARVQFSDGSGFLIYILGLGVFPLCFVLCCLWRWPYHSVDRRFQGGPPLCICCKVC